jgi:hypothetical protein
MPLGVHPGRAAGINGFYTKNNLATAKVLKDFVQL